MTIPDGLNETATAATPLNTSWRIIRAEDASTQPRDRRVLLIESYGAGSHMRVARLLQEASRHQIDTLVLGRDHWRTLALTGHRAIAAALRTLDAKHYELMIFSGPADVRLALASIPATWRRTPVATYFHESQWTYPAGSLDRIPHLVNHLETIEVSDAVWFNSRYHRDTFYTSAWQHASRTVRALAREILPNEWHKTAVLYPPVRVANLPVRRDESLTLAWAARWEGDKRPDRLLAVVRSLLAGGLPVRLHILGAARASWVDDARIADDLRNIIQPESGFLRRADYERVLAGSHIWLSTAEHEYFGVAALEAALLGAVPVVPAALAYPETLPSALTYPPGDIDAAVQRITAVYRAGTPRRGPWTLDAARFRSEASVQHVDDAIAALVLRSSTSDQD